MSAGRGEGALPTEHAPPRGGRRRRHRARASMALGFAPAQKTRLRGTCPSRPRHRRVSIRTLAHNHRRACRPVARRKVRSEPGSARDPLSDSEGGEPLEIVRAAGWRCRRWRGRCRRRRLTTRAPGGTSGRAGSRTSARWRRAPSRRRRRRACTPATNRIEPIAVSPLKANSCQRTSGAWRVTETRALHVHGVTHRMAAATGKRTACACMASTSPSVGLSSTTDTAHATDASVAAPMPGTKRARRGASACPRRSSAPLRRA